jgi:polycystin 1L2
MLGKMYYMFMLLVLVNSRYYIIFFLFFSFIFFCDDWLALDIGDGNIDRIIAAMSKNSIEFETLLSQHARLNMTENHLWLSLLLRPQKSSFTRVQRLSCILVLLFLAMITNAMFFQPEDEETVTADTVRLGAFRLSLRAVYISVVGAVITIIPLFLITFLFRNSRAKKTIDKTSKNDSDNNDVVEYNSPDIRLVETGKLPHWVIYIAWTIVTLAVVASAFFLLLYSMQWGTEISNEWLTTFVLSFLESILVVDPVKVQLIYLFINV